MGRTERKKEKQDGKADERGWEVSAGDTERNDIQEGTWYIFYERIHHCSVQSRIVPGHSILISRITVVRYV